MTLDFLREGLENTRKMRRIEIEWSSERKRKQLTDRGKRKISPLSRYKFRFCFYGRSLTRLKSCLRIRGLARIPPDAG
ncbi:MAG: hypothetical protein V2G48_06355 [bacterium JZ-2024 1]